MAINKKNIFLVNTAESMPYAGRGYGGFNKPVRSVRSHSEYISKQLESAYNDSAVEKKSLAAAFRYKKGVYLEFSSAAGYDLAINSLENMRVGIRLLNVREESDDTIKATVYIPEGQEKYFINKVEAYATELTGKGHPKNRDLVESIENVKLAILESFWIGKKETMPANDLVWCEIWLRYDHGKTNTNALAEVEKHFLELCKQNEIKIDGNKIVFPERIVRLVLADEAQLKMIISSSPHIAEIRRAEEPPAFFTSLPNYEQREWVDELLARTHFLDQEIALCLLDTGLTADHPLLHSAIQSSGVHAVNPAWGIGDHMGHGTAMAGIAMYGDLKQAFLDNEPIYIPHKLESVKILPPTKENRPDLYGAITEQAVAVAEIYNPGDRRIFCMAVTSSKYNTIDGSPTSWSAAVDRITSAADDEGSKKLFLISAGNVDPAEQAINGYSDANILHGVESPGQSWNALTVGACSQSIIIDDPSYAGYSPVAALGELSPHSSTSVTWDNKWPVKPEILLDGGNMATNGIDFSGCADLSLLTTGHLPFASLLATTSGTSAATALAAQMAAKIAAEYPDAWPETIRALMVHSATWTDSMKRQFCSDDTKTIGRKQLLRTCGYGVPDLQKAIQCMNNSVNLVVQNELQPYAKDKMHEMHLHKLPWPKEVLRSLGDVRVTLKVTLSYYIEPGPGEVGWNHKYRYPSCGLRFDLINDNETKDDFKKRINVKMRGIDTTDTGEGTSGSDRWFLGSNNRDVGSIHSDFCTLNAVDLCDCNYVAIYPIVGWWRERAYLGKSNSKVRYSLIVSLSTPVEDIDLYTPIIAQIRTPVTVDIGSM